VTREAWRELHQYLDRRSGMLEARAILQLDRADAIICRAVASELTRVKSHMRHILARKRKARRAA
jgi:hypothetical protein